MSDSLLERINPFRLTDDVTLYQTLPNVAEPKPAEPSKPDDEKGKPAPAGKPYPGKPKPK